ncbi:MAG TPA: hypothetical protein VNX86_16520 [Rhizomicrobium sp.]|jgi:hypothetical protein|nr:hypothetical protein [Rhizomicrobium sp.]
MKQGYIYHAVLRCMVVALAASASPGQVSARVVIGADATQNMTCSAGICAPTAANAVLNVSDLETLLASGNVTVTTTGAGVQARDITVLAGFSWTSGGALTLDAFRALAIDAPVLVGGLSGLSLVTDDGGKNGALSFGGNGNVGFANLSSSLNIDGTPYAFVNTVAGLASAIAANPGGAYAFAGSYDASRDGTYSAAPVSTTFRGAFEGLGNAISNLTVSEGNTGSVGLFADIAAGGTVRDIGIMSPNMTGAGVSTVGALAGTNAGVIAGSFALGGSIAGAYAGGLAGVNSGTLSHSYATSPTLGSMAGGLVADNFGTISLSYATGAVVGNHPVSNTGGGLAGTNEANAGIVQSFATGAIASTDGQYDCDYGGLVGSNAGAISQSYALGSATSGPLGEEGGLVGRNAHTAAIVRSYSAGAVTGGSGSYPGGSIGYDQSRSGSIAHNYWDTSTSGIANLAQGAGNIPNDSGIAGLSGSKLQSGLPEGFDAKVWSESANINGGLPYLLANPPPK